MILPTTRIRASFIADAFAPYLVPGSRVLDIGCGDGLVAEVLRRRFELEITGADVRRRLAVELPFVELAAEASLPFAADAFDIALLNDVLHHVPFDRQQALVEEALRVVRTVLIFEVEPGRLISWFDKAVNFFHDRDMPVPLAFRPAAEWQHLLAGPGRELAVRALGRPARWYPFRHLVIRIAHAQSTPLQSAVRELHPR